MPVTLQPACPAYGCPHTARTCPDHGRRAATRAYDEHRGSAHSRGYGAQWRRYTLSYRQRLVALGIPPVCGARLPEAPVTTDSRCAQEGKVTSGHVVDHIMPVSGPHDPRFYDPANHQLLCDGRGCGCHDAKRQRERRR